jgi:thiamine kinase-like enzyme
MSSINSRTEDRIRTLSCWNGPISIEPLHGGLSNESYLIGDASGRHVVRLGIDYPFHHVSRARETMTARAAHAAGFAPKVEHAEPGIMVTQFLTAQTLSGVDIAARSDQIARLLKRFHQDMPHHVAGPGFMFWAFHVIRDYARTLDAGNSRMRAELPRYLSLAAELEAAQAPLPIVFGHNDLLPSNILDDGERLWLIDFEYAGFSTAMFDLAGATSNAGLSPEQSEAFFEAYLGVPPSSDLRRSMAAMQCASLLREAMWSMVSELYLDAPGADYIGYTADNLKRLDEALDHYHSIYGKQRS